jgi:hypothetical protein
MEKRTIHQIMRSLHKDVGFLIIGFVVIFSLSGIVLIYRNTDFLKHKVTVEKSLKADLTNEELGRELRMRDFKVEKEEGSMVLFDNGSYDRTTGVVVFQTREIIFPFNKFIDLHKVNGSNSIHWFTLIFGMLLLFLAISSFWMYKPGTKNFIRGLIFTFLGIVIAVIVLFM